MRLLFDANLSHRLVSTILDDFPQSTHVRHVGLMHGSDDEIWQYAREHGFAIVTLDSDFYDLSVLRGFPPRVIWVRSRDTTTDTLTQVFRRQTRQMHAFFADPDAACLMLKARR
ncbi:MAG: DUF5615 family PIN-like protein [Alphaproteobacteria bacterium]|nr:DUF5615 family PIN-like protein [Alphaproteobacteria bacterium]